MVFFKIRQRWNSLTAFLVEVFEHKLVFSTLSFPFYKMLFMDRLNFLVSVGFFLKGLLKPE
jgi:hypothetical protein